MFYRMQLVNDKLLLKIYFLIKQKWGIDNYYYIHSKKHFVLKTVLSKIFVLNF